jgi:hypothetical protein
MGPSRRHPRSLSAVFKIFFIHPKKTFSTVSTKRRHPTDRIASAKMSSDAIPNRSVPA